MMTMPFAQPEPEPTKVVPVLPLRYCEFRTASQEYGETTPEVVLCAVMASEVIEEMSFCLQHGTVVATALQNLRGGG